MLDRRPVGIVGPRALFWGWVSLLLLIVTTRLAIAPRYLYHFDAANFALSINEFNPTLHQPQPPGYPFFVGLLRLLHLLLPDTQQTLVVAGLIGSVAALALLYYLGNRLPDAPAGMLAVVVLACNPVFWFGGVTNQVRVWMAVGSLVVAVLAWETMQRANSFPWLLAGFASLGLMAGFRPALGVQLLPLLLFVWWRNDRRFSHLALAIAALAAATLPWVMAASAASGGVPTWLSAMWGYANEQFHDSSLAFGAPTKGAWRMFQQAFVWNLLGALSWIWAVPFLRRNPFSRPLLAFLLTWFLPIFLFSAFVHIGDPDQALGSVPALCLVGGVVLRAYLQQRTVRHMAAVPAAVLALNALLFFLPPGRLARASSYTAVHRIDQRTRTVMATIHSLRPTGPFCIDYEASVPTWRQVGYYFPEAYLHVKGPQPFVLQQNRRLEPQVTLPGCSRTVYVPPDSAPVLIANRP